MPLAKKLMPRFKPEVREIKPDQVIKEEKIAKKEIKGTANPKKSTKKTTQKATQKATKASKTSQPAQKKGKQTVLPTKKSKSKR